MLRTWSSSNHYNYLETVKVSLKSFDVDAITKRDIILANEIEKEAESNFV